MFILSALDKRGPFHAAKVLTFGEMCNTFTGILRRDKKKEAHAHAGLFL
jgi:hypothetical protein